MTNQHTPGPWKLELIDKWPFGIRITGSNGNEVMHQAAQAHSTKQKSRKDCENGVGFVGGGEFARESAIRAIATQDANARLIAAAPETAAERDRLKEINAELLEALVRISLDIDRQRRAGMNLSLLCLCTESIANAAIAKATGQALKALADIGQELNI